MNAPQRPDPGLIWQVINGCSAYWVAVAAVELGVFDALSESPMDGEKLAKGLGCDPDRLGLLCDALVGVGLVARAEGRQRAPRLLARAAQAASPGAHIVVADYFVDDDHRGPLNALLLGATMIAATPTGGTFTREQFASWLGSVGFTDIEVQEPSPFHAVMVARAPGGMVSGIKEGGA